eukprot:1514561-Pleurochrysis_carterae.AAC.2
MGEPQPAAGFRSACRTTTDMQFQILSVYGYDARQWGMGGREGDAGEIPVHTHRNCKSTPRSPSGRSSPD